MLCEVASGVRCTYLLAGQKPRRSLNAMFAPVHIRADDHGIVCGCHTFAVWAVLLAGLRGLVRARA